MDTHGSPGRCKGCGRPPASCWIMPCLVLEQALASGPRAVFAWGKAAGIEIRPKSDLRVRKDPGVEPDPAAERVHTSRAGIAYVTRDADGLFYVWHVYRGETTWLYGFRSKTPAIAKARQLGRDFGRKDTAS